MNYDDFLHSKQRIPPACGFEMPKDRMNPMMFEWQKDITRWALRKGRAALFEDCGNGKTIQQLEFCKESYFNLAVENCRKAEKQAAQDNTEQPSLFDLLDGAGDAV